MTDPLTCRLWTDTDATLAAPMQQCFALVDTLFKDSHHWRYLLQCRDCNALYLLEFYEEIDWEGGNDPTWITYVPVTSAADGAALGRRASTAQLRQITPRIEKDWPRDAPAPIIRRIAPPATARGATDV